VVIQRYLCTRDAGQARRSLGICMLGDIAILLVLYILGIALLGFFLRFPELLPDPGVLVTEQADRLFPHFIGHVLPPGITGLLVAALFAAAMSSLDSGISSIASVLMTDFKAVLARGAGTDERRLMVRARWASVCIGVTAIALSFSNIGVMMLNPDANLFEIGFKISNFFIAPLFVLFVLAFFFKGSTPAGAWAAVITGFLAGVLFSYWKPIVGLLFETQEFSFLWIAPAATLCSAGAGMAVSAFTKPRSQTHS
jgi:SSS family solute:Na+ symporter